MWSLKAWPPQLSTGCPSPRSSHPRRCRDICRSVQLALLNRGECSRRYSPHSSFVLMEEKNERNPLKIWHWWHSQVLNSTVARNCRKWSLRCLLNRYTHLRETHSKAQMLEALFPALHIPWLYLNGRMRPVIAKHPVMSDTPSLNDEYELGSSFSCLEVEKQTRKCFAALAQGFTESTKAIILGFSCTAVSWRVKGICNLTPKYTKIKLYPGTVVRVL